MKKWRLLLVLREFASSLYPGRHASRFKSSYGLGVEGVKPFDFDDAFSSFDFVRYIITDEEYVVERPSDRTARIYLFLDRSRSMEIGWGGRTRLEASLHLASLFIEGLADEGNQIGIGVVTDRIEFVPILKSGGRALRSELENAIQKRCAGQETDFRAIRDFLFADAPPGSVVFIISDWESSTLSRELLEDIDDICWLIPIVFLERAEENEKWLLGDAAVIDAETGDQIVCGGIINDHRFREVFESAGIEAIELFTGDNDEAWKAAIEEFFEARKKMRLQRRKR